MRIPLDRSSAVPLYQQIRQFISTQIASGSLSQDTKLPSTRQLATALDVSRIVVADAYAELEAEGLVYSLRGSGTFVSHLYASPKDGFASPTDWPIWQQQLLSNTWQPVYPEVARMLWAGRGAGTINLAEQAGIDELWPVEDFRKALKTVLRRDGPEAMGQGQDTAGYLPLRATVAEILSSQGIPTQPDNVLITSGSQQGLSLVAELLLRPGDVVLVESPTYNAAIDLFRSMDVRLLGVPVDEDGMQVERVEEVLRSARPRLIYTIPTFQNPSGACMSGGRRRQLVSLADRYNIPILEDDFIGNLRYEGRAEPALKTLDPGGRVIYVGRFSKLLLPGLRVGFVVAHGPVYDRLLLSKYVTDLATSDLTQRVVEEYISVGRFYGHLRRICSANRRRRDAMLKALIRYLPGETHWLHPKGGRFVWLQLPFGLSANDLFPLAAEEGVLFVPGSVFFPGERPQSYLRLSFAINPPDTAEEGVQRLGRAVQRLLAVSERRRRSSASMPIT